MRIFVELLLTLFLFSCAANQRVAEPESAGALSVDGLSIWDERSGAVPSELAADFQKAEALWAEEIPTCDGPDSIACLTKTLQTWLSSHRRKLGALEKKLVPVFKANPAQRMAVLIILAKSYDSMAQNLRSMPVPERLRGDSACGATSGAWPSGGNLLAMGEIVPWMYSSRRRGMCPVKNFTSCRVRCA